MEFLGAYQHEIIMDSYSLKAISLLKQLIEIPSLSKEENKTADLIFTFLQTNGFSPERSGNNVWVRSSISERLPTILLNSHHDTVKPSSSWTLDPFTPKEKDGKIYGLGSNDAGASVVSQMMAFFELSTQTKRPYNLIYSATAEEEITGLGGVISILPQLGPIDLAVVGEPTQMQMAVAEKGLMVLDCKVIGKTGHAARNEGVNAIYLAMEDMDWFRTFQFPKESDILGKVKTSVTMVNSGYQHNVVPDTCTYVVDVRTNEHYSNQQALDIIKGYMKNSEVIPRSTRHNSSHIPLDHPLVKRGQAMGLTYYGSPTTSDQAVIRLTSMKIGPGDSARSHTADEFILIDEIKFGIETYINLLNNLVIP
jgi:acetylornithine deacetylase